MTHAAFVALALTASLLLASPAASQQPKCDARDRVMSHLATQYDETPVAVGVTNRGTLLEVLSTANGSTWTIVVTMPDGISCLVAAGEGWQMKAHVLEGPDA